MVRHAGVPDCILSALQLSWGTVSPTCASEALAGVRMPMPSVLALSDVCVYPLDSDLHQFNVPAASRAHHSVTVLSPQKTTDLDATTQAGQWWQALRQEVCFDP